ncbi:MAG: type II toxin-antitoxin system prevent-host-death family antitoxin [Gemmatimonadetes bacterium]|jgi:prevent-host-death family protein|nr:type II toxin-antitoxin system prevent-host-death family antitoxin [Gemmatimonadota bacterium]
MLSATIRDARLNLSKLLKLAEQGHEIIIRNRERPVAKLVPYLEPAPKPFPDLSEFRSSLRKRKGSSTSSEELVRRDRDER